MHIEILFSREVAKKDLLAEVAHGYGLLLFVLAVKHFYEKSQFQFLYSKFFKGLRCEH